MKLSQRKINRYASRNNGGDETKPWYDQPEIFVDPYQLKPPYENVYVGPDPHDGMTKAFADQFDAIVNVSSTPCVVFEPSRPDQRTYWYPIIEMGRWSLGYLFWLKQILDFHYESGHKIYLHCHAGAFRSPSAACLWLESRGHTAEEALALGSYSGKDSGLYKIQKSHGNIPKRKDILFDMMRKQEAEAEERGYGEPCIESICHYSMYDVWDHETMSGKHRTESILRHYFWFYYRPKWWMKEQWSTFKAWALKREGWVGSKGVGSYHYKRAKFFTWSAFAEPLVTKEYGSRQMGDYSYLPGIGWTTVKKYNHETRVWDWLVNKCPKCEGRGAFREDPNAEFGKGWAHCEDCSRTGVK